MIRGKRPSRLKHESRRRLQQAPWPLPAAQSAPAMVSLLDAAHYLGIHASTLRRWIRNGKIKAVPRVTEGVHQAVGVAKSDDAPVVVEMKEIMRVLGTDGGGGRAADGSPSAEHPRKN